MNDKPDPIDVKTVWQTQSAEGTSMPLEEIRGRVGQLEKKLRKRYTVGGIVCVFIMVAFTRTLFVQSNLIEEIGSVLTVIGAAYIGYQILLIRKKPIGAVVGETEWSTSAKFYRSELERQRDFHRGLWFWSRLVIFLPGPLIRLIGRAVVHPELVHRIWVVAILFIMLAITGVATNLWRAREYQRDIDELDQVK
jgi:hypothetical protein